MDNAKAGQLPYLIISDLDGSLLDDKESLTPRTIEVVRQVIAAGHVFCIATGRHKRGAEAIYRSLALDTIMMNLNGAVFCNPSDPNFKEVYLSFSRKIVRKILISEKLMSKLDNIMIENEDGRFFLNQPTDPEVRAQIHKFFHIDDTPGGEPQYGETALTNLKNDVNSILLQVKNEHDVHEVMAKIKSLVGTLDVNHWSIPSVGKIIDVHSTFTNKGMGAKYLSSYYGIPSDRMISFGDGDNDVALLDFSKFSYALKNAKDVAKYAARGITRFTNHENGVAEELNYWLVNNKFV